MSIDDGWNAIDRAYEDDYERGIFEADQAGESREDMAERWEKAYIAGDISGEVELNYWDDVLEDMCGNVIASMILQGDIEGLQKIAKAKLFEWTENYCDE